MATSPIERTKELQAAFKQKPQPLITPPTPLDWMWNPLFGVRLLQGSCGHRLILADNSEMETMPKIYNGVEEIAPYEAPRGYCVINWEKKTLKYTRYPRWGHEAVDAQAVDDTVRKEFLVPAEFETILHPPYDQWTNNDNFRFSNYQFG